MEDTRHAEFEEYVNQRFPPGTKRSSSGTVLADFGARLTKYLKARDLSEEDKNFRFWAKKRRFQVMNIPSLCAKDVLVVPVKETTAEKVGKLFTCVYSKFVT